MFSVLSNFIFLCNSAGGLKASAEDRHLVRQCAPLQVLIGEADTLSISYLVGSGDWTISIIYCSTVFWGTSRDSFNSVLLLSLCLLLNHYIMSLTLCLPSPLVMLCSLCLCLYAGIPSLWAVCIHLTFNWSFQTCPVSPLLLLLLFLTSVAVEITSVVIWCYINKIHLHLAGSVFPDNERNDKCYITLQVL